MADSRYCTAETNTVKQLSSNIKKKRNKAFLGPAWIWGQWMALVRSAREGTWSALTEEPERGRASKINV